MDTSLQELGRLAALVGTWRGEGNGRWGEARFGYMEELEFSHTGKPHLVYAQRTHASDDGRPLHAERGFWRAAGVTVELVLAQGIGVAEVSLGGWVDDYLLRTRSAALHVTPSAKPVTAVERLYELRGDVLTCTLSMATGGGELLPHLHSRMRRVP